MTSSKRRLLIFNHIVEAEYMKNGHLHVVYHTSPSLEDARRIFDYLSSTRGEDN